MVSVVLDMLATHCAWVDDMRQDSTYFGSKADLTNPRRLFQFVYDVWNNLSRNFKTTVRDLMQLIPSETSLVVAGAWNPAILTPGWVLRHGLNRPVGQSEQVQVFVPAGAGLMFEFPRYALPEFTFVVRPDSLILAPTDPNPESFPVMEDAAAAMIEYLRHTPINGIGHNFEYRDAEPSADDLKIFSSSRQDVSDFMPEGWDAAAALINSSFRKTDDSVVLTVSRQFDAGSIVVKFNFHHPIANAEQAAQVLRGQENYKRMTENFRSAEALVAALYGEK